MNNVIKINLGGYAGGMMIAYCSGATIKNNLIAYNTVTGSFNGGGGVYVDWESITLENNTIVFNHSGDFSGGIISTGTATAVINSIVYGNTATNGFDQIFPRFSGNANVTYTNIEGGFEGAGNEEGQIDTPPIFENLSNFLLDPTSPGNVLFPSQGTIINDMGANGGQGAIEFSSIKKNTTLSGIEFSYQNPYHNEGIIVDSYRDTQLNVTIYSYDGKLISKPLEVTINKRKNVVPLFINSFCLVVFTSMNKNGKVLKSIKL